MRSASSAPQLGSSPSSAGASAPRRPAPRGRRRRRGRRLAGSRDLPRSPGRSRRLSRITGSSSASSVSRSCVTVAVTSARPRRRSRRRRRRRRRWRRRAPRRRRRRAAGARPRLRAAAYIAAPSFWLTVASFSVAVLIASMSVPSSAFFSSASGSSTSALTSAGHLVGVVARGTSRSGRPATRPVLRVSASSRRLRSSSAYCLGLAHHPLDVVLRQRGAAGDRHRLLLAGAEVLGGDVHDAVGVDVEGDLDLRHAARRRRQAGQLEHAELLVVRRHLALALVDLDLHRRLVVVGRGEDLGALGRDRGVALDELGHDAALGLDAEGQRGDVEQQDVLDLALEHAGLQAAPTATTSSGLTPLLGSLPPVSSLTRSATAGMRVEPPTSTTWSMSSTLMPASLMTLVERRLAAVEQVGGHLLELGAGERLVEVQRALGGGGDVGQVDARSRPSWTARSWPSRRPRAGAASPSCPWTGRCRGAFLNCVDQLVDDALVPVVATEVVVAAGGLDLDDALADLEQGHVEGAAAEVEDEDGLLLLALVEAVRERGRGRLVDDAQDVEARDLAGLLGGLALGVVEVRRDGDDRVGDRLAEVGLGVALELLQDERADLLRR